VRAIFTVALLAAGAALGAEVWNRGWHGVGSVGGGAEGADAVSGIWRHITSVRLTCEDGEGKLDMVWIEDGGRRYQWSVHRRMREGDQVMQPIDCQRVTGVRVFGEGTAQYSVELHSDSRRAEN
jgi:hypothetical protein